MTAPERIWAFYSNIFDTRWTSKVNKGATEYVRADLHDATKAQLAKAVEALQKIANGNPTCDSPEADAATSAVIARAALAALKGGAA